MIQSTIGARGRQKEEKMNDKQEFLEDKPHANFIQQTKERRRSVI